MNTTTPTDRNVMVWNPKGRSSVVVVCEHASCYIPEIYGNLGLVDTALKSHAAWDPGALAVAHGLAARLDAVVVASTVSRLVYDCNRPPSAESAIPDQSETIKIPGNVNLSSEQRQERVATVYEPFRVVLAKTITATEAPVIVTIHSFTPVYHSEPRAVEIGILHDTDTRLADAMLQTACAHTDMLVMRNAPYGPEHGVTHTLKEHALPHGHLNVMIEVRNDLIKTETQQVAMADCMSRWVSDALMQLQSAGDLQCQV